MEKEYLLVLIDGQEKKAEIKRKMSGINKYSLIVDGLTYAFQYNSTFYDDPMYRYVWAGGYLIRNSKGQRIVIDCQIKHIKS